MHALHPRNSVAFGSNGSLAALEARHEAQETMLKEISRSLKNLQRQNGTGKPAPRTNLLSFLTEELKIAPPSEGMSESLMHNMITLTADSAIAASHETGDEPPSEADILNFAAEMDNIRLGRQPAPYKPGYPRPGGPSHTSAIPKPPYQPRSPPQWCPFHQENHWTACPYNQLTTADLDALLDRKVKQATTQL
ncbi:hypothetical protein BC829DRAFT_417274 [Chytridium lagenaria]|nr:hypothetical protein BC829DRAFT_417274 [Chytridium lagenaria]